MHGPLVVERRFRGPPESGNGGYSCGLLGVRFVGPAEVTLRRPPPLDSPMTVEERDNRLVVLDGDAIVMEGARASIEDMNPVRVSFEDAARAAASFEGFHNHAFLGCFVCGPERAEGDGLRIFPGSLGGGAAAPWTPGESTADERGIVRPEIVWAALDCPTGWATFYATPGGGVALLGRLAARLLMPIRTGERYVAAAWPAGIEGRKQFATSAILSAGGAVCAVARATWIELRP